MLIMTDQQAANTLGCYGNTFVSTPNLDRMAREGARFDCHISNCPLCAPARSSIITGRSVSAHRVYRNGFDLKSANLPTFADMLNQAGYATVWNGKAHWQCQMDGIHGEDGPYFGFTETHITEDNQIGEYFDWIQKNYPEFVRIATAMLFNLPPKAHKYWAGRKYISPADINKARNDTHIPDFEKGLCYWTNPLPEEITQNAWITDHTIAALKKYTEAGRKFFITASYVDPHDPLNPTKNFIKELEANRCPPPKVKYGEHAGSPPHYRDYIAGKGHHPQWIKSMVGMDLLEWKKARTHYFAKVNAVDFYIGKLLSVLRELGIYEDTTIMFTADHGDMMGDHGMIAKGDFHYDSCIRVPMIIKTIDMSKMQNIHQATSHLDIFPTMLDAAGISPSKYLHLEGHSLLPLTRGKPTGHPDFAFAEIYGSYAPHSPDKWAKTIRNRKWRYTWFPGNKYGQLFDLQKDPDEFNNLWDSEEHKEVKREMLIRLLNIMATTIAPLPETKFPV